MGLQRETAGRGSMAVYTQIVFATILERIFFHAVPTTLSVIGTLLIISSALYVAVSPFYFLIVEKLLTMTTCFPLADEGKGKRKGRAVYDEYDDDEQYGIE